MCIALYPWVYTYPTRLLLICHFPGILLLTYELEYKIEISKPDNYHVLNWKDHMPHLERGGGWIGATQFLLLFQLRYDTKINSLDSSYGEFIYEESYTIKQGTTSKIYEIRCKLVMRKEVTELKHTETQGWFP